MASMKGEWPSRNFASGKIKKLSNLFAKKEVLNIADFGSKQTTCNFTRMVLRSGSKDRSASKTSNSKPNLSGWTFTSVKNDVKEKSQLSSSINNLLKVVSTSKTDTDIVEECATTKPVDVTQKQIFDHCSLSSSIGNRISRSIYDLTSVERLKRWKAKLPSVRHKPHHHQQQQQQTRNNIGTIPPSGTFVTQMRSTSVEKVDSSKNGQNSQSDKKNNIVASTVGQLSPIMVLTDSNHDQTAPVESNLFRDQPRLTTICLNVEKPPNDDERLLSKFEEDNSIFTNNLDQCGRSSNHTTSPDIYFATGNNYLNARTKSSENDKENCSPANSIKLNSIINNVDVILDEYQLNSTKNTNISLNCRLSIENDENADVYEELDCHKQPGLNCYKQISPVKLAPTGGILNEMSALPRPSAFRPFKSSKTGTDQKPTEIVAVTQTLERASLYDNFVQKSKINFTKPPSPPPRRCNGSNRNLHIDPDAVSASEKPGFYQRTSFHKTVNSVQNPSPSSNIIQPGFYKSFVSSKVDAVPQNYQNVKISGSNRFPNCSYVLPSSITDSGVSIQNYSTTCSFSSRNSSGLSDSGLTEVENTCKNKDSEMTSLRQSVEQNEQIIVQVYQENERKWQSKLKQWSSRVEQSIEVEQQLLKQIEHLNDDQTQLQRKVQTLGAEKQGLQRKCKELESELFTLKQQINEKRKHWEICRDCGKIFVPDTMTCVEKYNGNFANTVVTPSLDGVLTLSTKAATVSEELRSEMDTLKQEVTNVKSALQQQIEKFTQERQIWDNEKRQVLECHKMLEDNYGWLVHNNNNSATPSKFKSSAFKEISSNF